MSTGESKMELSFGSDKHKTETLFFKPQHFNDAVTVFSNKVVELDGDDDVSAAWVRLIGLPDAVNAEVRHIAAWTKTSNERITFTGSLVENY